MTKKNKEYKNIIKLYLLLFFREIVLFFRSYLKPTPVDW